MTLRSLLSSKGRGRGYSKGRGLVEATLQQLYRGAWPAKLTKRAGWLPQVVARFADFRVLEPGAAPLRIGFVSDLHLGPTTHEDLQDQAFAHLRAERIDVLLLGGDYVFLDVTPAKAARLKSLIQSVECTQKFAVMGNHDLWADDQCIKHALVAAGVTVLANQNARLSAPHSDVTIVGLDDPWTGVRDEGRTIEAAHTPIRVVLCHAPDALPWVLGAAPTLYLCGHTHGGHVAAPWGPLIVPGIVGKTYPHGLHRVQDTWLFVSRGIGSTEISFRTYAAPDVLILNLLPKSVAVA